MASMVTSNADLEEQINAPISGKPVVLNVDTLLPYFKTTPLAARMFTPGAALTVEDSSTGNLNYCFIVKDESAGNSVFVKQAPDFLKCLGEDVKLTTERIRFEANAALEFMKVAPEFLPQLYHFDATSCVMAMEHLKQPWCLLQVPYLFLPLCAS